MQVSDTYKDKPVHLHDTAVDYCLQLLINEHGDVHIDTLSQLLTLTSFVEVELSHHYTSHPA